MINFKFLNINKLKRKLKAHGKRDEEPLNELRGAPASCKETLEEESMKTFTARLLAPLTVIGLGIMPAACGEKPSFTQQESTVNNRRSGSTSVTGQQADQVKRDVPEEPSDGDDVGTSDASGSCDSLKETCTRIYVPTDGGTGSDPTPDTSGSGSGSDDGTDTGVPDGDPTLPPSGSGSGSPDGSASGGTDGDPTLPPFGSGSGSPDGPVTSGTEGEPTLPTRKTMTREMVFPADTRANAEVSKTLDDAYLTQTLQLKRNYAEKAKTVTQITRPGAVDNFEQGLSGSAVSETFDQVAGRLLDILVVIDNSGSMANEQKNLSDKLSKLLDQVDAADWQIGVVTTDASDTCLRGLVKKTDADPVGKFKTAVTAGIKGDSNERPFLAAVQSLRGTCLPQPWIRKDSNIAVLVVSDEDNCSIKGEGCGSDPWKKAAYLTDYLKTIGELGKTVRVHGIISHPDLTAAQCAPYYEQNDSRPHRSYQLAEAIAATGGTWGSICDGDYTNTLKAVSANIFVTLNSKFLLKQAPDLSTLRVFVGATEQTSGYTVTGRLLEFANPPPEGAKVSVSYSHGSTPRAKVYPLRFKPLADKLYVTVNGQLVQPADYKVNVGATSSVEFYAYPVDAAKIAVSYTRDVALNTQFGVGEPVRAGSVRARVNGVETTDFTVIESDGIVTFGTAPADGATILLSFVTVGTKILSYPFTVNGGAPVDLEVADATTGAPVKFAYQSGAVVIDATEFVEGRRIVLRYDNTARQHFEIELPNTPLAGSVVAYGGMTECKQVTLTGNVVAVDACGFADDVISVAVRYAFVTARIQEFTFTGDRLPSPSDYQEWKVLVNGQPATGYTRVANVVTFDRTLPLGAVVKIQLIQDDK